MKREKHSFSFFYILQNFSITSMGVVESETLSQTALCIRGNSCVISTGKFVICEGPINESDDPYLASGIVH